MESSELQKQDAIDTHSRQSLKFASRYQVMADDVYSKCFTYSRHRLNQWLDQYLPANGAGLKVLDVGCGTGNQMKSLHERGFTVVGVDGSADMLEKARVNNPGAEFHQTDVEKLPFAEASFDLVICIEVLRYLPANDPCLREMVRVLKPGGVCLTTAAPLFSLNGYLPVNRLANKFALGDLTRVKQFFTTENRLRREFLQAGFVSSEIHGVYSGPFIWVERVLPAVIPSLLKAWEPLDNALADRPLLRELSNMFLVRALRAE